VTFYVEGFDKRLFALLRSSPTAMKELRNDTGQPPTVFEKLADGHWFVTRKTAELTLRTLTKLEADGAIPHGMSADLRVQCGVTKTRSSTGRTIWPIIEEVVLYRPDEYLSPAAWNTMPTQDRIAIKAPPF
jgi:hypothetical protein